MTPYSIKVTFKDSNSRPVKRNKEVVNPLYDLSVSFFSVEIMNSELVCFEDHKVSSCTAMKMN